MKQIKALLFDLDGTLVDSEPHWFEGDRLLLRNYEIDFTLKMKEEYIGRDVRNMMTQVKEKYSINEAVEALIQKKNESYLSVIPGKIKMFPRMKTLFEQLGKLNLPRGLATGSGNMVIPSVLKEVGLEQSFDAVVGADDAERGKPAPDIFLACAKKLTIAPENCLVFEDSQPGVIAAKQAGMMCVAIPSGPIDLKLSTFEAYSRADFIVEKGMDALDPDSLLAWIKQYC